MRRELGVWCVVAGLLWGHVWGYASARAEEGPGAEGLAAAPASTSGPARRAVVVDAATYGIDPVVGEHVTHRMRATLEAMGYQVVGPADTVAAARRVRMAYPPDPADLWRVTHAAGAIRGAFARVWAEGGQYVVEVTAASLDGTGPFVEQGRAAAETLHGEVARLTRGAVPAPAAWDARSAARLQARPSQARGEHAPGVPRDAGTMPRRRRPTKPPEDDRTPRHRFELALQTEAAIGASADRFYNHLLGLRLGVRINEDLILGASLGYANLRGRGNRAHNVLPLLHMEYRVRVGEDIPLNIPLRVALGYLPFNGPVVRLAAGLNFPVGDRVELGLDLLAPTFWILPGTAAVSFNLASELVVRL